MYFIIFVIIPIIALLILNKKRKDDKIIYYFTIGYSLVELIFMLVLYVLNQSVAPYNMTSYFITYKNGFISRGLIGTISEKVFHYDTNFELKVQIAYWLVIIIAYAIELIIYRKFYKNYKAKNRFISNVISLYLLSFSSVIFFTLTNANGLVYNYRFAEFLRFDLFHYLIMEICFLIFLKDKTKIVDYLLITILSCIGIVIHQGILFTFLIPIIFFAFYKSFYIDKTKEKIICFFVFLTIIATTFLICQFSKNVTYLQMLEQVYTEVQETGKKGLTESQEKMLKMEYSLSPLEFLQYDGWKQNISFWYGGLFYLIIYNIHIVALFILILKNFDIKVKDNIFMLLFAIGVVLLKIVLFVLMIDWIRWFTFMEMETFYIILYLLIKDDKYNYEKMEKENEKIFKFIKSKKLC